MIGNGPCIGRRWHDGQLGAHPDLELELQVSPMLDRADFEASIRRAFRVGARCRVAMERSEEFVGVAAGACRDGQAIRSLSAARAAHADLRASDGQPQLFPG